MVILQFGYPGEKKTTEYCMGQLLQMHTACFRWPFFQVNLG